MDSKPGLRADFFVWLAGTSAVLAPPAALSAADDPYMLALDGEIDKVEPSPVGVDSGDQSPSVDSLEARVLVRDRFESMLQRRYAGTFSFYTRLPERSRQEILSEHRNGADIAQLRRTIVDRFDGSR